MEQEPERTFPFDTILRVGQTVRLAAHLVFIITASLLASILLVSLFLSSMN